MSEQTTKRLLTVEEAAAQLDVSTATVYAKLSSGEWPCTRMTRKIRFTPEQITQIIALGAVEPVQHQPRRRKAG